MPKFRKTPFSESEVREIRVLLKTTKLGVIARRFGVNKPAIIKALDSWDSEPQDFPDGFRYRMIRGKMVRVGKIENGRSGEQNTN